MLKTLQRMISSRSSVNMRSVLQQQRHAVSSAGSLSHKVHTASVALLAISKGLGDQHNSKSCCCH